MILAPLKRERHPVVTYKAAFSLSGDSVDGERGRKVNYIKSNQESLV